MLKHGILGLLNYHEMTGYEIMVAFRDSLRFFWNAQQSQIYRELQALEAKGWAGKTPVPQQGKPDKNLYAITPEGHEELLKWLAQPELQSNDRNRILMKVFFFGERSREENIAYFEGLRDYYAMLLQSLDVVPESIRAYGQFLDDGDKTLYWEMAVEYGRRNMRMHMDWAQSCIDRLMEEK